MIDKSQSQIIDNWPKKFDKPKVSIACFTYNHESFIKDTVDGFLEQKTDFPFEIVIGEDCSTDSTYEILIKYKEKYPDLIKYGQYNVKSTEKLNYKLHLKSIFLLTLLGS